ncbi:MAG: hypothetical protein ABJA84_00160 [Polaromonas sp.]
MKTTREQIIDAMPGTALQLVERTGRGKSTVDLHLSAARHEIHISAWIRSVRGQASAVYSAGQGDDAPKLATGKSLSAMRRQAIAASQVAAESLVGRALRTQPVSIFDVGRRA